MRTVSVAAIAFVLAMPAESLAHRLDEYLQATRLSLARDGVAVEVDLTPGVNIAADIVTLLDRDGDNTISSLEARAYGEAVLADLVLRLDDQAVQLTLTRVEIPSFAEIADGVGTIQLRAAGNVTAILAGRRHLYFQNNHQPASSVYLVNALLPQDRAVDVAEQRRDPRQQTVRIEYNVGSRWLAQLLWLLLGAAAPAMLIVLRRGRYPFFACSANAAP